jgi:hypothetical protein
VRQRRLPTYFLVSDGAGEGAGAAVEGLAPGALVPPEAAPGAGAASPPLDASEGAGAAGALLAGGVAGGDTCGAGAGAGLGSSLPHPATARAANAATRIVRFIVFLGVFCLNVGNNARLLAAGQRF